MIQKISPCYTKPLPKWQTYQFKNDNSSSNTEEKTAVVSKNDTKSSYFPLSFKSREAYNITRSLMQLDDIHCPFCGVKMHSLEKTKKLVKQAESIQDKDEFINWLELNKENIPKEYLKFIDSAKNNAILSTTTDVNSLLLNMKDGACVASSKAIEKMKEKMLEIQKNNDLSDSDNVLIDECYIRLSDYDVFSGTNILYDLTLILRETIGILENTKVNGEIYAQAKELLIPASFYQNIFLPEPKSYFAKTYQGNVISKLFENTENQVCKVLKTPQKDNDPKLNLILCCKDCEQKASETNVVLRSFTKTDDLRKNIVKYIEDLSKQVLDNKLQADSAYIIDFANFLDRISEINININKEKSKIINAIRIKAFKDEHEKVTFEPVNREGIPCATCGQTTITHEQRLKIFNEIAKASTYSDLLNIIRKNRYFVSNRFQSAVRLFEKLVEENPQITEKQLINEFKKQLADEIKQQLQDNITLAEMTKNRMSFPEDTVLLQKYIDGVKSKFLNFSEKSMFPYQEYTDLLKDSVYKMNDTHYKYYYGTMFKETIRKKYNKQANIFPNKETIEKLNSYLKVYLQNLFKGTVATVDHLIPKGKNGENDLSNYVVMCRNCNTEKTDYPLLRWLVIHPEMPKNVQKYMNKIVSMINNNELGPEYRKYPEIFSKKIAQLSHGKVDPKYKLKPLKNDSGEIKPKKHH